MRKDKSAANRKPSIPDNEIIDRFGGIRPMASKLGVAVTTVQGWKERGHIPEGRIAQIIQAAAEHGIDVGVAAAPAKEPEAPPPISAQAVPAAAKKPDPEPQPKPEPAPMAEPEKTRQPGAAAKAEAAPAPAPAGGVSRLTLFAVVVLLGGAIATGPLWQAKIYPGSEGAPATDPARLDEIAAGLTEIEAGLRDLARDIENRERSLAGRLDALEAGGGETGAAFADQLAAIERGVSALDSGVSGLESRIARMEAERGEVPEGVKAGLQAVDAALDDLRGQIAGLDSASGSMKDGLSSVGDTVGGLEARIAALEARPVQSGEKIASMVLALGQVEAAMNSGQPYRKALNRLEYLGRDDPLISGGGALAALSPWADYGIPDRLTLRRRFAELAPEIDRALSGAEDGGWMDSVWNRISGLVTIRRIDGGASSPIAKAELALEEGDLVSVAEAFEGKGSLGPEGDAWMNLVTARIEAEQEIGVLYGEMIGPLAGNGAEGAAAQ